MRLYDVENGWHLRKDVQTRQSRWTITDTAVSPDQRLLIYASIIPVCVCVWRGEGGRQPGPAPAHLCRHHPGVCVCGGGVREGRGGGEGQGGEVGNLHVIIYTSLCV